MQNSFCRKHLFALLALLFCTELISAQNSQVFDAIRRNDLTTLKQLLDKKINLDIYDADSQTVLMNAALYAPVEYMEILIQHGAPVDAKNPAGQTALMWSTGDFRKAKLLLDHGANPNSRAASGNTPLLVASIGSHQYEMVKLLLDHGANPMAENKRGETAINRVALFGDTTTARLLLNKGLSVNQRPNKAKSTLLMAVLNNNKPMIYWLLENGADPNLLDNAQAPVLSYAVDLNDVDIVKAILGKMTDSVLNSRDIDGMTPLMWAVYDEHDNVAVVQALLDRGADFRIRDNKGRTVLDWALKKGNSARVALLRKLDTPGTR